MNISITDLHKVYPKRILSSTEEITPNAEEFSLAVPLDYAQGPYVLMLEFEKETVFNRLVLEDISFQEDFKIVAHHCVGIEEGRQLWKRIPLIHFQHSQTSALADFPLTRTKAVQIIFSGLYDSGVASLQIQKVKLQFYARPSLKAGSEENRLWVAENLIDGRDDYGWASTVYDKQEKDFLEIDLGQLFYFNELRLRAVKEAPNCFPVNFSLLASLDKAEWQTLMSEDDFYAVSGAWYVWKTSLARCRYLRLSIDKHFQKKKEQFVSKILEALFFVVPENHLEQQTKSLAQYMASESIAGIMTFAAHNSFLPHKAVQSNDPRLRAASVAYPGIVRLAKDGEIKESLVVQSTDARLKTAGEENVGLVRLAKDKEEAAERVVQGNDSRLKKATPQNAGIVQLAQDKEVSSHKVVQSNDSRLKEGNEEQAGIVCFAKDNESLPLRALQSNDSRLKKAGVEWPGIVIMAAHGESSPLKTVQSDDPRLKEGNETIKGRVMFAKDNESAPLKALQSNDSRLKKASQTDHGFALFAHHEESSPLKAVQSDDPRLKDARTPLPHSHTYAALEHDLNSHKGKLNLDINEEHMPLAGIEISSPQRYPLSVKNSQGYAALFQGGLISRSEKAASVLALGDKVTGIESRTRAADAAVFLSEQETALYLPKAIGQLRGSGKSLKVEGSSEFNAPVYIDSKVLSLLWKKNSSESFSEGDILSLDEEGRVKRISDARQTVVGVYTRNSNGLFLKSKKEEDFSVPVAIAGIAKVRIKGSVKVGDKVGFFFGEAGVGKRLERNMETAVVGIALETATQEKEHLVKCFLRFR